MFPDRDKGRLRLSRCIRLRCCVCVPRSLHQLGAAGRVFTAATAYVFIVDFGKAFRVVSFLFADRTTFYATSRAECSAVF